MKIKKISKIKDVGILQDFNHSNLTSPEFKDINLIFGWNGTGKTTLSRVLRCYELGEVCSKLKKYSSIECDIELGSGSKLSQNDFTTKQQIRVFNKDFVEENIFQDKNQDGGNVKAIYYLGKEKIELVKEREDKSKKELEMEALRIDYISKTKEFDKFTQDSAKEIKDVLLGIKEFQHYHKDSFVKSFDDLKLKNSKGFDIKTLKVPEKEFEDKLKTVKNFEALELWIKDIKNTSEVIDFEYINSVAKILEKTVSIQKTIEGLKKDWGLSNWVQQGISIHKDRNSTDCEFCGQKLPNQRIKDLEQHFNKDYIELVDLVGEKIKELDKLKIKEDVKIPNKKTRDLAESLNKIVDGLILRVELKQRNILTKQTFNQEDKEKIIKELEDINKSVVEISKEYLVLQKN